MIALAFVLAFIALVVVVVAAVVADPSEASEGVRERFSDEAKTLGDVGSTIHSLTVTVTSSRAAAAHHTSWYIRGICGGGR